MSRQQQIHLYILCWNDARMLRFFFRHYDPIVDHYFVYDNGSTDQSLEILAGRPNVTVSHFDVPGDSFVAEERRLSDSIWKQSRGEADWVIVLDIDEHLFRPRLREYLLRCTEHSITALRGIGYEMVADLFPSVDAARAAAGRDRACLR